MRFNNLVKNILNENTKQQLFYNFKCTDADEDGIFEDTPFGTIDTNEFSQFISGIEEHEISFEDFKERFILPKNDNVLEQSGEYTYSFYFDGKWVVIFDGDTHFIYSIS